MIGVVKIPIPVEGKFLPDDNKKENNVFVLYTLSDDIKSIKLLIGDGSDQNFNTYINNSSRFLSLVQNY